MIHRVFLTFGLIGLLGSFSNGSAVAQTQPESGHAGNAVSSLSAVSSTAASAEGWRTKFYGFVELDAIHDSTQSFTEASLNAPVAPRGTYLGDYGRTQFTAKNSRIGLLARAPTFGWLSASGHINFDFFGAQATELTENDFYVVGTMRLRQAYLNLRTPIVDLLVGQHPSLLGWGGAGFYPGTVAFLGTPGLVYHQDAQIRMSKSVGDQLVVEPAVAVVRPAQRDAEIPDVEAGIRAAYHGWSGRTVQGNDRPETIPLSFGVSGLWRNFAVAEYRMIPRRPQKTTGWGVAANAFVPIIPVKGADDFRNALTLTAEFSTGTGMADRYSFLTGGARFQSLPNPGAAFISPLYHPNIDNGLVTFDPDEKLKTIDWQAFVLGLQYYLPIPVVRVWVTGIYARLKSDNVADLTPLPDHGNIFTRTEYVDGSLFVGVTPDVHFGLSLQMTEQKRASGPVARNVRAHFATNLFF